MFVKKAQSMAFGRPSAAPLFLLCFHANAFGSTAANN
jgi:hypothetical protein